MLNFRGGTPTSLNNTGEQWDFPNCWAPVQALIIQGLENTKQSDAQNLADELARRWLHANYVGFQSSQMMYEKVSSNGQRSRPASESRPIINVKHFISMLLIQKTHLF